MKLADRDLVSLLLYALVDDEEDPVKGLLDGLAAEARAFACVNTAELDEDISMVFISFERKALVAAELHRRRVEELTAAAPESRQEKKAG
jgi:hypothetical protein